MLCIIAGNYQEALAFAKMQDIPKGDWFFPSDETELLSRKDFHVLVVGSAGQNVPPAYFERVWNLAKLRGRMK